jgi:pimeloyl-ACP methyl ester carboxylesterase
MFDQGSGDPLVVIPGVQGRWEWMRPALRTLARDRRVISFTLPGDLGSGMPMDPALGFDVFVKKIDAVLDEARVERAAICGVSYGGLIAVRYAAVRPERVSALILTSAPGPGWRPTARQARYVAKPWLSMPAFCVTALDRLRCEMRAALPDWRARIGFTLAYVGDVMTAPTFPGLMARRVRLQQQTPLQSDCQRIVAPTLVVTGDESLDLVVPVTSTREYLRLIPGAKYEVMDHTGHLGMLTQPDRFAGILKEFLASRS